MKRWQWLTVAAMAVTTACGSGTHPAGDAASGEVLYPVHCASCHGDDGKSGSAGEDIVSEVAEEGDEVFDIILNGKDNGAMPAFKDVLTEQEIADIIAWLETQ